jgi:uncharacterized protein (TIGR03435 family)
MIRRLASWLLPVIWASSLPAQTTAPSEPAPQFEVATIRSSPPISNGGFFRIGTSRSGSTVEFGRQSLKQLIANAYGVKAFQVSGPEWMGKTLFDVQAKVPEGASPEQVLLMLQALLAERFGLKLHHESKDLPGWALVVAKSGAKLTAADPPGPPSEQDLAKRMADLAPGMADVMARAQEHAKAEREAKADAAASPSGAKAEPPKPKGHFNTTSSLNGGVLNGLGVTMQQVAEILSRYAGRQVANATGIEGTYNIRIDVSPDEVANGRAPLARALMDSMPRPAPPAAAPSGGDAGSMGPLVARGGRGADITGISLFQSIQRYGLKLESHKETFDILVIDHTEKTPTEN